MKPAHTRKSAALTARMTRSVPMRCFLLGSLLPRGVHRACQWGKAGHETRCDGKNRNWPQRRLSAVVLRCTIRPNWWAAAHDFAGRVARSAAGERGPVRLAGEHASRTQRVDTRPRVAGPPSCILATSPRPIVQTSGRVLRQHPAKLRGSERAGAVKHDGTATASPLGT